MASSSDGLTDQILFDVALCADRGLDVKRFIQRVKTFHAVVPPKDERPRAGDDDLFLSARPPTKVITVNSAYLETVWSWLEAHPDVSVQSAEDDKAGHKAHPSKTPDVNQTQGSSEDDDTESFRTAHAATCLVTTNERIWLALTGHNQDWKRMPKLEFQCLTVIAFHGSRGILQPDLVAGTGQDKRSVPKRTDALANKGYIVKELCIGAGAKTSLLRLKKFVTQDQANTHFEINTGMTRCKKTMGVLAENGDHKMVRYEQWFDDLLALFKKQNGNIMTMEHLVDSLAASKTKLKLRALRRGVRRLEDNGLLRLFDAVVQTQDIAKAAAADYASDEDAAADEDDDDKHTGKRKSKKRPSKKSSSRRVHCVEMLRESTESDRTAFLNMRGESAPVKAGDPDAAGAQDELGDDIDMLEAMEQDPSHEKVRVPPQWDPLVHHTNFMFEWIQSHGIDGIPSYDLIKTTMGECWRRPLDEMMTKLTEAWSTSQPPHLRHLGILRDTATRGTGTHYVYRSFDNHKIAVERGKALWGDRVDPQKGVDDSLESATLDEWGFPRVDPAILVSGTGAVSAAHCAAYKPRKTQQGLKVETPKTKGSREKLQYKWATASPQAGTNPAATYGEDAEPIEDSRIAVHDSHTDNAGRNGIGQSGETEEVMSGPGTYVPRIVQLRLDVAAKRAAQEVEEWKRRTKKLAEARALQELAAMQRAKTQQDAVQPIAAELVAIEPTSKRKRGRNRKEDLVPQQAAATPEPIVQQPTVKSTLKRKRGLPSKDEHRRQEPALAQGVDVHRESAEPPVKRKRGRLGKQPIEPAQQYSNPVTETNSPSSDHNETPESVMDREVRAATPLAVNDQPEDRGPPTTPFLPEGPPLIPEAGPPMPLAGKRKHDALAYDSAQSDADRVIELQNAIMSLSTAGVYINPPGSNDIKRITHSVQGRPRNVLIAVFKSERLKGSSWFVQQESDTKIIKVTKDSMTFLEGTELPVPPTRPPTGRAQLRQESQLASQEPSSTIYENDWHVEDYVMSGSLGADTELPADETSSNMITGPDLTHHRATLPVSLETQDAESPTPVPGSVAQADSTPQDMMDVTKKPRATRISHENDPDAAREVRAKQTSVALTNGAGSHQATTKSDDATVQDMPSSQISPTSGARPAPSHDGMSGNYNSSHKNAEALGVFQMLKAKSSIKAGHRSQKMPSKKLAANRTGGIVHFQRLKMVIDIIHRCGGVFPGERELFYPLATEWSRQYNVTPDVTTLTRLLKSLVSSKRIQRIPFTFKDKTGMNVTRHVLAEPGIHPRSLEIVAVQQKIIELYPAQYVPDSAPMLSLYRQRVSNHPTVASSFQARQLFRRSRNARPEDSGLEGIIRTGSSGVEKLVKAPSNVTLGMLERKIKEGAAERRKRRKIEERLTQRYMEAAEEETLDQAVLDLASEFQLDSYVHEPKRANVDRGLYGRKRLGKVLKFGTESSHARPLGSLATMRQRRMESQAQAGAQASFSNFRHMEIDPRYVIELLTLTIPYQFLHASSGTFSTDPSIVVIGSGLQHDCHGADRLFEPPARTVDRPQNTPSTYPMPSVQEFYPMAYLSQFYQTPYSLQTYATSAQPPSHQADHHPQPDSMQYLPQSRPVQGPIGSRFINYVPFLPSGALLPSYWPNLPSAQVQQTSAGYGLPPTATDEQSSWPKTPFVPNQVPAYRSGPRTRQSKPRRSRAHAMKWSDDQRLVLAIAIVRTLAGGLDQSPKNIINWGLVHQAFRYRYDIRYCRNRWGVLRQRQASTLEHLQQRFRKLFLEAYEDDELPEIDLAYPETIDWAYLADWMEEQMGHDGGSELSLPSTREAFDREHEMQISEQSFLVDAEESFISIPTMIRRYDVAHDLCATIPLDGTGPNARHRGDSLALAKSWVRANILTPDERYDSSAAARMLEQIGRKNVNAAVDQLQSEKMIKAENKGRLIPGRNFSLADSTIAAFKRDWDLNMLRDASNSKLELDTRFAREGRMELEYVALDGHILALLNLEASGRITIEPILPPVTNDHDAPFPKISKWGLMEGAYKTVHMNKDNLKWGLEIRPTATYEYGNPLLAVGPPVSKQFTNEIGPRLPYWTDIHSGCIEGHWMLVLVAMVHVLSLRPGCDAAGIARMIKGKLWAWEVELFLQWAEESGVARRMSLGEGAEGWCVAEWWWMAFANPKLHEQGAVLSEYVMGGAARV